MNIVFITFYEAYPPVSGAASVSWNVAKHVNGETTLIQIGFQDVGSSIQDNVNIITLRGFDENRLRKVLRMPGWIIRIVSHIKQIKPDIVIFEGASWVMYHLFLIKTIHLLAKSCKLIYHSHNVEYTLRKDKHSRFITEATRWAEGRILYKVDIATAVSQVDSSLFEKLYGIRTKLLPNGVDIDTFDQVSIAQIDVVKKKYRLTDKTILFMGSYLYKPNQEGIDFLINKVMPKVIRRYPDAKLAIIGGEIPYKKQWLTAPGYIPFQRLPAFVKACAIGVAPIFSGSGTRLKILEYMAAGKPVVSTTKGAEGIIAKAGVDFLVAEKEIDFATAICQLLTDCTLSDSIGRKGRKIVNKFYSWNKILKDFPTVQTILP